MGTLNDNLYAALVAAGFTGTLNDMMKASLESEGYTGTVNDMIKAKAVAVGYRGNNMLQMMIDNPAGGAIELVGVTSATGVNPTVDISGISVSSGDFILVLQTSFESNVDPTITAQDNNTVSLTTLYDLYGEDTVDHNTAGFYKIADGTETSISVSSTTSSSFVITVVMVWSNVDTTTPLDTTPVTLRRNDKVEAIIPDITTVTDSALVISIATTALWSPYASGWANDYGAPDLANGDLTSTWTSYKHLGASNNTMISLGYSEVSTAGLYSVGTASHAASSASAFDSHGIQIALRPA